MGVVAEGTVPEQRTVGLTTVVAGLVIGAVEVVFAVSFAALVFAGYLEFYFLDEGVGLYLGAAALTLAFMAWRAGRRGIVGGLQGTGAAVMAIVSASVVVHGAGSPNDIFLSALAAGVVAMVLCGVVFFWLGSRRRGDLIRFVPYPVVGGFLAGTGWLLFKGGVYVASGVSPFFKPLSDLGAAEALQRWLPTLAFGVILLIAVRVDQAPARDPGGDRDRARGVRGRGGRHRLLFGGGPRRRVAARILRFGDLVGDVDVQRARRRRLVGGAPIVGRDRDRGLRCHVRDLVQHLRHRARLGPGPRHQPGAPRRGRPERRVGGARGDPGYHALSLTALAEHMRVDARAAGLIAALVPLAAVVVGAEVVGMIPRMIVGGVLVFLGLAFMVEWVWDKRRSLPRLEYAVVLVILVAIIVWGFLIGVVIGLVAAVVLFAISYGRIELVHEVAFGETYRSTVDRPAEERAELRELSDRVQILRVSGFVFFGSTNRLLERI